jgi:hypothetical protein
MRLYPRIPDAESVKQHYIRMAEGKLPHTEHYGSGRRLGGARSRYTFISSAPKEPVVRLVTPTAQAEEQARALLGQTRKQSSKRKAPAQGDKRGQKKKKLGKGKTIKGCVHKKRVQPGKRH